MKFKIKLPHINDIALFCSACSKFQESITYTIGNKTVNAKSLNGMLSLTVNKIADVEIDTENIRVIDEFISQITLWLIGEY